jgi:hypothetical protein
MEWGFERFPYLSDFKKLIDPSTWSAQHDLEHLPADIATPI